MNEENSKTILIIDDEQLIRESYADFLEDRDFQVIQAENGRIGLDIMKKECPDLVLTDLRMPEVNGLEVLQSASKMSPDTPLIVISGTGQISDSIQALRFGAWDYILKPVEDMSIIAHAVDQALERAQLLAENRAYQENLESLVQERTAELEQVNKRLSRINERLHKVAKTTRELTACSDVERFGSTLLNEFAAHMMASGGSLFLIEEGGLRLLHTLDSSHIPEFIPFPLPDTSVFQHAIDAEKPLLIENINTERNISSSGWKGYKDSSVLVFPLPDESGKIVGVLSLHSKVEPPFVEQDKEIGSILASHGSETLRAVQSSDAVRESEARQRSILNSLRIGVLVIDPEAQKVVESNLEAAQLIGVSEEQLIGSKCRFFNCCVKGQKCQFIDPDVTVNNSEEVLYTNDGNELAILKTVVPFQLGGRLHLLESFIDISRRKTVEEEKEKLEAQLIRAQKMEAVGTLAGGLAHDLNNALNGIFAPTAILISKLNVDVPLPHDLASRQLNRIEQSGYRISDMVSQLMAVSYKQELSLTAVDLNVSVKHVVKIAQNTFDKSIEILPEPSPTPARTAADPTQIEQVILNLAINASHAMTIMRDQDETWGGRLEIGIEHVQADKLLLKLNLDLSVNAYWKVSVADTGVGMGDQVLTRIFTPFYTTKEKGHGTGLGLSMVYSIVTQHNGFIEVESKPSIGTTFNVYLPEIDYEESKALMMDKVETISMGEGLILIVDDEEVSRITAEEILKECGYDTITAENGFQATEIYQDKYQEINMVVLDMVMPKMSGKETYAKMQTINPEVKAILVSGFRQDERIETILEMGDIEFMQKPYDMIDFSKLVKRIIS